jgi:hypothetical protein
VSWAWKQSNLHDFLNQNEKKGKPIFKSRSWNKTIKNKNMTHVKKKSKMKFYYEEEMKTEQGYDKKTYSKLVLNILKIIRNSIFIYTF